MVAFKSKQKKFEGDLNIKSCGKTLLYWKTTILEKQRAHFGKG